MSKVPKRANKAIGLLENLVEKLHYFYGDHQDFRNDVLKPAMEIEDILKDLSINKKETFKRISRKYEDYYKRKQAAMDTVVSNVSHEDLNESLKKRYDKEVIK